MESYSMFEFYLIVTAWSIYLVMFSLGEKRKLLLSRNLDVTVLREVHQVKFCLNFFLSPGRILSPHLEKYKLWMKCYQQFLFFSLVYLSARF